MSTLPRPVVFGDLLPISDARTHKTVYAVGFAALAALAAQTVIPFGFTAGSITLLTAVVLLAGAVLGSKLGAISMTVYAAAGLVFPIFPDGAKGLEYLTGDNGGYIIGGILAAYLVGLFAERAQDRTVLTALAATVLGVAAFYLVGTVWLAVSADISAATAVDQGITPFLIADAIKALAIAILMPVAWHFSKKADAKTS